MESPVHINEVALRIANAAGLKRTGKRIRGRVNWAVSAGIRERKLARKGEFLWCPDHDEVSIRRRDDVPNSIRQADMIAPQEIEAALKCAVRVSHGIDANGAVTEAGRLFGYRRIGADIRSIFRKTLDRLILKGAVVESDGQVFCNEDCDEICKDQ